MGDTIKQLAGNPFGKTQTKPKIVQTDPFKNYKGEQQAGEDVLFNTPGMMGGGGGGVGSPYVAPSGRETAALDAMQNFGRAGRPLFTTGLNELDKTAQGAYLDPTKTAAYQGLKGATGSMADQMFRDQESNIRAQAAMNPGGSARYRLAAQAGGNIASDMAQKLAASGWGQYANERGYQDTAANTTMNLAPSLAGKVFSGEEAQASIQQKGKIAALRGELAAQGLRGEQADTVLRYLGMLTGDAVPYVPGHGAWDQAQVAKSHWAPSIGAFGGGGSDNANSHIPTSGVGAY